LRYLPQNTKMPRLIFEKFKMNNWTVLKLGGSILSPKETINRKNKVLFDYEFALKFLESIKTWQQKKLIEKIAIIVGGGTLNKQYLETTLEFLEENKFSTKEVSNNLKDHVGIAAIALNAHTFLILATSYFSKEAVYQDVIKYKDYDRLEDFKIKDRVQILVGGRHKPGFSSDLDALNLAKFLNSNKVISLKNVDGIYDKDPNKHTDARYFKNLTWNEYKKILGDVKYEPRSHFPIDVVATKEAAKNNLEFVVMDGRDLKNFEKYLKKEEFRGTKVS
jgi:uridylate kinase